MVSLNPLHFSVSLGYVTVQDGLQVGVWKCRGWEHRVEADRYPSYIPFQIGVSEPIILVTPWLFLQRTEGSGVVRLSKFAAEI
jgi:hypothetical protein